MNLPTPSRRYSDKEVRKLLERAAELQENEAVAPGATGMTLQQLESVALEAGIDPAALRRAAEEMEVAPRPGIGKALAGAPMSAVIERTLPFEVSSDALESLIPLIQARSETSGQGGIAGSTLTWRATSQGSARDLQILVASRNGETRIRIEDRHGQLAGGLFGGVLGGVGGGVGLGAGLPIGLIFGSAAITVGFPILFIGGTYAACRAGFRNIVARRSREIQQLADTLEDQLQTEDPTS
jgi:hypothetical protein